MFIFPSDITKVNLIFRFTVSSGLVPEGLPSDTYRRIADPTRNQATEAGIPRNKHQVVKTKGRQDLEAFPGMLRDQDFTLVQMHHGLDHQKKSEADTVSADYGCKFLFVRNSSTTHQTEMMRYNELELLVRDRLWRTFARTFVQNPDMLVITCSSPKIKE